MKQSPPFCVQVEPTQGCNLQCTFCGINSIQRKPAEQYKNMTIETAKRIASEMNRLKWNSRIEFAMHGEPTMNLSIVDIIRTFRQLLPRNQLMITSNGGGLLRGGDPNKNIEELFDAGLNILALDAYENVKIVPKILKKLPSVKDRSYETIPYPSYKTTRTPHSRWPRGTRVVLVVQDISKATEGTHATLNNHCGGGAPLNTAGEGKKCAKPFRELSVRWDGSIALCCNSFSGRYDCGNVNELRLDQIWNGKAFRIARLHLYHGMRTFTPCKGCDATSYRVGLLPDAKGLESLPKPSKMERQWAIDHGSAKPLTPEVQKVEWKK